MRRGIGVGVLIGLTALFAAGVSSHWVPTRDSALYMSLGRSLAEGRGMEFNGHQTWGIPPVVPLMIAGSQALAGDEPWLLHGMMAILALGVVGLSYLMLRELAPDLPEAWRDPFIFGALLMVGTSAELFEGARCVLTDVPFLFWVMLGLYSFLRSRRGHWSWCLIGSVAFLVATYTRLFGVVLFAGVALGVLLDFHREGYRRRVVAVLAGGAVVGAGFAFWLLVMRHWSDPGTFDYLAQNQRTLLAHQPWKRIFGAVIAIPPSLANAMTDQKMPWVSLLLTALLGIGAVAAMRRRQWLVVGPVLVYVTWLAWTGYMAGRYLLAIMPILVYFLFLGLLTTAAFVNRRLRRRPAAKEPGASALPRPAVQWIVGATVAVALVISMPKNVREIYWLHHPQFIEVIDHGQWRDIVEVSEYLQEHGRPETDRVAVTEGRIVHWLTRMRTDELGVRIRQDWQERLALPQAIAEQITAGECRFAVVPTDIPDWSREVAERLDASGIFGGPPRLIGHYAVYERGGEPPPSQPD
jgi:4-amino-4-deoxy-L-arabinose transferase-like glycosyltransferase